MRQASARAVLFAVMTVITAGTAAAQVVAPSPGAQVPPPQPIDLGIKKSGGGTVSVGGQINFTLTTFNNGPGTLTTGGATVTDTLPPGISPITASGPGWNCTVVGQNVTCTYVGPPVPPGQLLPPINIQGAAHTPGQFSNCAKISLNGAGDPVPGNDSSCAPYVVVDGHPVFDLLAKKSPVGPAGGGFNLNA